MRIATGMIVVFFASVPNLARAEDADTRGAIHAMTGRHRHHHHRIHPVRIARDVHHRRHPWILLPPGTSRPGQGRDFIPAH